MDIVKLLFPGDGLDLTIRHQTLINTARSFLLENGYNPADSVPCPVYAVAYPAGNGLRFYEVYSFLTDLETVDVISILDTDAIVCKINDRKLCKQIKTLLDSGFQIELFTREQEKIMAKPEIQKPKIRFIRKKDNVLVATIFKGSKGLKHDFTDWEVYTNEELTTLDRKNTKRKSNFLTELPLDGFKTIKKNRYIRVRYRSGDVVSPWSDVFVLKVS